MYVEGPFEKMMFSEYGGPARPPAQWNQAPAHHQMYPGAHYGQGPPGQMTGPGGYPPRRIDATSEVFTCLFGDLFVKW